MYWKWHRHPVYWNVSPCFVPGTCMCVYVNMSFSLPRQPLRWAAGQLYAFTHTHTYLHIYLQAHGACPRQPAGWAAGQSQNSLAASEPSGPTYLQGMLTCVCVCVYVCMCVCLQRSRCLRTLWTNLFTEYAFCMYACMCVYMDIYTCINIHVYMCMYVCMYICIRAIYMDACESGFDYECAFLQLVGTENIAEMMSTHKHTYIHTFNTDPQCLMHFLAAWGHRKSRWNDWTQHPKGENVRYGLFVCVHVCIVCTYMYALYVHTRVCTHMYACMCICMCMHKRERTFEDFVCAYTCMHGKFVYIPHVYIFTHIWWQAEAREGKTTQRHAYHSSAVRMYNVCIRMYTYNVCIRMCKRQTWDALPLLPFS
jgi:hypothetical protein